MKKQKNSNIRLILFSFLVVSILFSAVQFIFKGKDDVVDNVGIQSTTNGVVANMKLHDYELTDPPKRTEKINIKNTVFKQNAGANLIYGEATNNDSLSHDVSLMGTFYDSAGNITGTALGSIDNIAPNETKTFYLLTTEDVGNYSNFKVQINTII